MVKVTFIISVAFIWQAIFLNSFHSTNFQNSASVATSPNSNQLKKSVSIESYGAKPNDANFDNAPCIINALNNADTIIIPAGKTYTIRSCIQVSNLSAKVIKAAKATLINRNYDARTFLFINCNNINIIGGTYTRDVMPTIQNGKEQSTIGFKNCKNVSVKQTHIIYSPEMGIDNNIVIGGVFMNNHIEHCLRDGIYAHYSANLKYSYNILNDIKDDALSMHDYGLDNQKDMLHKAGFKQAGHSEISSNKINNCIQGISSIACKDILIAKNTINNTVNAGICIFNSEDLYANSTARVNHITISNNTLINTGFKSIINKIQIPNKAQISSGRAAIYVACIRQGKEFTTSKMRSSAVKVINNTVLNSAVNAATLYNIDGLIVKNNSFKNCHADTENAPEYTGDIVEILNCTKIDVSGNNVIDSRTKPLHNRSYKIENSVGAFKSGISKGFKVEKVSSIKSRLL
jgi:hypothetical protein